MKNVEIITSQNVVLQYELASLQDRIIAFILDTVTLLFCWAILTTVFTAIFSFSSTARSAVVILLAGAACLYSLAFEAFNHGRSVGKMAMKIQVIKLTGGNASFSDYAARWVFRLVDIYLSLGGIASLLILSSAKGQRIGDIIANTVVVKAQLKTTIDLSDLLSIHESNKYIPVYQQAKKLQEHHALLIKATLERYRRFRNESHGEAVEQLSHQIQDMLGIHSVNEKKTEFLQTILKDYVVLSR
ncbi:MAG TPA: hypothetical protein DGG95_17430 [Cytophagales bacterium]|jgi:uncharacterized RDD family membrane protein YckC|nr:hypothetical protein [Cytophagales bacterium]